MKHPTGLHPGRIVFRSLFLENKLLVGDAVPCRGIVMDCSRNSILYEDRTLRAIAKTTTAVLAR